MDRATAPGQALLEVGIAAAPRPGETTSGDGQVVAPFPGGVLVVVLDALGHGPEAAAAAQRALSVFSASAGESLSDLVRRCHIALTGRRGVVVALAAFDAHRATMTWAGVGNVEGVLVRAHDDQQVVRTGLVTRGGIVGSDLPEVRSQQVALDRGDIVAFATDGVRREFVDHVYSGAAVQPLAEELLARFGKGTDDALVFVARYRGSDR